MGATSPNYLQQRLQLLLEESLLVHEPHRGVRRTAERPVVILHQRFYRLCSDLAGRKEKKAVGAEVG